ncbi:acyl-CoA thioesterase II [Microthyrium microscopicum]|uniref:Acyl-CoA thioesterase II n=1 Tax=Microthyrium microscopicum TaxID=703497 RepID=A0A6A6UQE9_9PEZI|nr:acyl-CoA thioesterase II [Microthyrium microscopicum]
MATIKDLLALKSTGQDTFESLSFPDRMGNAALIAYGGCTLGVAAHAAYLTVPSTHHAYSLQGAFLGPALIDRVYTIHVTRQRDTRTFATRLVDVRQTLDDGSTRSCLTLLADFMTAEPKDLMTFSAPPTRDWGTPEDGLEYHAARKKLLDEGKIDERTYRRARTMIALALRTFDISHCHGSIMTEVLYGVAKMAPSSQDGMELTDKVSADWNKSSTKLSTEGEHVGALAFLMDMATSFIHLSHDHKFLDDAGACSSLDFSLRLFSNNININEWHLREMKAVVARQGRAYNEIRLWDSEKRLTAIMTQQGIMRPPPEKTKSNI